jgi:thioredoxin 1
VCERLSETGHLSETITIFEEETMRVPLIIGSIGLLVISAMASGCCAKSSSAKCCSQGKNACVQTTVTPASTDTVAHQVAAPAKCDTTAPEKTLLFFMNPNGHPCQMQEEVLSGMNEKLGALAKIQYIQTTDPAARAMFEKYGIRGLPSLIILDQSGKELTRFPPGIQSAETILAALNKK